jgi:beta-N-acetylhexosaminidase
MRTPKCGHHALFSAARFQDWGFRHPSGADDVHFTLAVLFLHLAFFPSSSEAVSKNLPVHEVDSLRIKIGQMIMVGFRGTDAASSGAVLRDIEGVRIGGVILFDYDVPAKAPVRNVVSPSQLRALTAVLQQRSEIPLFIAIDQEGGKVNRLKSKYGFPASVSQKALGRTGSADTARAAGERTGRTLAEAGITVNFAPALDLEANPDNPVIAKLERSFSPDPRVVTKLGSAMLEGLHSHGILCAVKHFPGHGSSRGDTHAGFVDVTSTWTHRELEPFAAMIREQRCDMVMTAHIVNRRLDPDLPSTLSRKVITSLLRDSLGFQGVVVSDDLQMKAITDEYGFEDAIRRAVEAGVDILLFGNNAGVFDAEVASKAVAVLRTLVASGALSESRIDESFRRIMALKRRK